ncbi:hypothetical protein [Parendozoicomonas sp. Alg238-R29]|uniref:hypothetical protein n=1 Tax=Parendozoicomonas sp. Alg238-R29 TaxID=2993446 RepID=UPI00248F1D03|nr:hypothetical protein [Parendozoicomonas sp. Alg238-R29]
MGYVKHQIWLLTLLFLFATPTLYISCGFAQEEPYGDIAPITPLQRDYEKLSFHIQKLEKENSFNDKLLTFGAVALLDIALELVHSGMIAYYSPSYLYGRPLNNKNDVKDILKHYLSYTFEHGHAPALAMGIAAWFSGNGASLPSLPVYDSATHIAAIATGVATLYGVLFLRVKTLLWRRQEVTPFFSSTTAMLNRIAPAHKYYLTAVDHLDMGKHLLQAAAVTVMISWGLMKRFQNKFAIDDLRQTLTLARDRLQRNNRKKVAAIEELKLKKKFEFEEVKSLLEKNSNKP